MKEFYLSDGLKVVFDMQKNTPRIALTIAFSIKGNDWNPGVISVLNRLFLQGTKKRTAEQLANELDENAINLYSELKQDYLRFNLQSLNEDFERGVEILSDIIFNSTLLEFDKEIIKLRGEIIADLDSPKLKAYDNFYKTIFENHSYGYSHTMILNNIENIEKNDVQKAYYQLINNSIKTMSLSGDLNEKNLSILKKYFGELKNSSDFSYSSNKLEIKGKKVVTITKDDANQAQIIQGWLVPTFNTKDYPKIALFNTILGASGLSSRLFLELRDKKGLAYTVRSAYETFFQSAVFSIYIGTEPKNINVSIEGFEFEINRLKNDLLDDKELSDAKTNLIGRRQFFTETNLQKACLINQYEIFGLGFNYEDEFIKAVKNVTKQDIMEIARKYLDSNYV